MAEGAGLPGVGQSVGHFIFGFQLHYGAFLIERMLLCLVIQFSARDKDSSNGFELIHG
jgi:hypothetical protein